MNPELTPGAERALTAAVAWAKKLGAADLEAAHVLLGLLDEEEGHPAALLARQQVALEDARNALLNVLPFPSPQRHLPSERPHDYAVVRQLVHAARLLALDLGERTASSLHLLLAALNQDIDLRSQLAGLGFNAEKLREALQAEEAPPLVLDEPLEFTSVTDEMQAARILDASANRAREALRVLEDYARFALSDAYLCGLAKELRHDLAAALGRISDRLLTAARDTEADVGTQIAAPAEGRRPSLRAVVLANVKRLAEALRSLEEYGKLASPEAGQALEQLRYRGYTLEKTLLLAAEARSHLENVKLYLLVSRATCAASLEWTIAEAVAGGADMVQLREKALPDRAWLELARRVRQATRKAKVPFILNDRPDLARLVEAEGVHLGQDDLSVADARLILGPDAIIGVSTHSVEQAKEAIKAGATYLGVGPTFASRTKEFASFPGLEYVSAVARLTTLPAFAVGGIAPANVAQVAAAGLKRIAVGQAITQASDPRQAAKTLRDPLE
jgi:thiamine-phosphate pyrophosphorylase